MTRAQLLRRSIPFVVGTLAALALEPFTGGRLRPGLWWAGIALATAGLLMAVLAVRGRRIAWLETCGGLVALLGMAVLRHGTGGTNGGYGGLVLLPVLWAALYGSRRQLYLIIGAAAVALAAPLTFFGPPTYPATGWRGSLVLLGVGVLAAMTTQELRDRLAAQTAVADARAAEMTSSLEAMAAPVARFTPVHDRHGLPVDLRCTFLNAAGRAIMSTDGVGDLASAWLTRSGMPEKLDVWLSALDSAEPVGYETVSQLLARRRVVLVQVVRVADGIVVSWRDVSAERKVEHDLRASMKRWHIVADVVADASIVVDDEFRVVHVSPSIADLLGVSVDVALGERVITAVVDEDRPMIERALHAALETDERQIVEFRVINIRAPDEELWLEARATGIDADADGTREITIGLRDVTAARIERDLLGHRASHDPLTGLLNRAGLQMHLDALRATTDHELFLMYIDLDRFKPVNDRYGHAAGDLVLRQIAARMVADSRLGDAVARIGGDEFAMIGAIPDMDVEARSIVERVRATIEEPVSIDAHTTVSVGASIGMVLSSAPATVDDLLIAADLDMYQQKRRRHADEPERPSDVR
jgi:diguanylate cyclase (GGDEF)-like protein/PAS domain S-box-containing protein